MIQRLEIPQYIREVQVSNARAKKYYELGKKHPKAKKYHDKEKYEYRTWPGFGKRKFLVDIATGERVIANARSAGTPRVLKINGQKIYNGEVSKHIRNKVLYDIKSSFAPYIEQLENIEKFPINIELEVHDVIRETAGNSLWDMDNRAWPYIKAFQDCLIGNKDKNGVFRNKAVLEDDNILYITQPPVPKFIPVEREEDRKLVLIIKEETDKRIIGNKGFKQELENLKKK
jgi:hypothetical protein